jgi:Skp family chaperone for outer membrane proteins
MTITNRITIGLAMPALTALAVAAAQPRDGAVSGPIAYVSGQRVSNESAEGKAGVARVQALQRERAADVKARQESLEQTRKLAAGATDLAERERLLGQEKRQRSELEREVARMQVDVQNLQRQISAEMTARVRAVLDETLKGTDVRAVLNSDSAVVWAAPGLDLTSTVIDKLDKQPPVAPEP